MTVPNLLDLDISQVILIVGTGAVKPLIEISIEQYESLLKYASDTSPLYSRL